MKYKHGWIYICLIICLFSIACISAADADDIAVQTDMDDAIALDDNVGDIDNAIASDEENGQDILADSNDDILTSQSFNTLQQIIDDAEEGSEINLTSDYTLLNGEKSIKITKNITIDGNGHTLNGAGLNRIIEIHAAAKNITFKNIIFESGVIKTNENSFGNEGGAILVQRSGTDIDTAKENSLTVINCKFNNNQVHNSGGAIYCEGDLYVINSTFENNVATSKNGGAIFCDRGRLYIERSKFIGNQVEKADKRVSLDPKIDELLGNYELLNVEAWKYYNGANDTLEAMTGGAVLSKGNCIVRDSEFQGNKVGNNSRQAGTSGGAIHSLGNLSVYNSTFTSNRVTDWGGGAIFCEKYCEIHGSTFTDNTANKGCAVYCWEDILVNNSEFSKNRHIEGTTFMETQTLTAAIMDLLGLPNVLPTLFVESTGGAILSNKNVQVYGSSFYDNSASEKGGAIYTRGDLTIGGVNNRFSRNSVLRGETGIISDFINWNGYDKDGGAIYCCGNLAVNAGIFEDNAAVVDGGAIYCEKESSFNGCVFTSNTLSGILARTSFGCAVCTDKLGTIQGCTFSDHKNIGEDTLVGTKTYRPDGGAIYVKSKCTPQLINSRFTNNRVEDRGGAIYLDSSDTQLTVTKCIFEKNKAYIDGGAIYCQGTTTITNSLFEDNSATGGTVERSFGGAIRSGKNLEITHTNFFNNNAYNNGGAAYGDGDTKITDCIFTGNTAKVDGGAVYSCGKTTIANSQFDNNKATGDTAARSFGGAVRSIKFTDIKNSTFSNSFAYNWGGAVYTDDGIDIKYSNFTGNSAKYAGAVYASTTNNPITDSIFKNNKATNGDGGAIYVYNRCNPKFYSCTFEQNSAAVDGGSIYLDSSNTYTTILDSIFKNNNAGARGGAIFAPSGTYNSEMELTACQFIENTAKEGGAIYASAVHTVTNSKFIRNNANSGHGGAMYINNKCNPRFYSCTFEQNTALNKGGAIYLDSLYFELTLSGCTFDSNKAGGYGGAVFADGDAIWNYGTIIENCEFTSNKGSLGGAVYTNKFLKPVVNTAFLKNRATWGSGSYYGDGGAVYINNKCDPEFVSCRFEDNTCRNLGGAIYLDSLQSNLKVSQSTFINNHAEKQKDTKSTILPGHSVYTKGYYTYIKDCWFGSSNPNFKNQFIEYKTVGTDSEYTPTNYLKSPIVFNQAPLSCADDVLGASDDVEIYAGTDLSISFYDHVESKHSNLVSHFSSPVAGKLILSVNGTPIFTKDIDNPDDGLRVYLYDLNITADGMYNISAEYIEANTSQKTNLGYDVVDVSGVDWGSDEYVTLFTYVDIMNAAGYFIDIENNGEYVNGSVCIYVDGDLKLTENVSSADEKMFFEISVTDLGIYNNITLGNHTVKVDYMKDGRERHEVEKTVQFYAEPVYVHDFIISETERDVLEIKYINGFKGNVTLYHASREKSNESETYEWIKGDVYKSANFTDGIAKIYLEGLSEGVRYFLLNITGYDLEKHVYVTVKKNSPAISASVTPSETTYGNNFTLKFSGAKNDTMLSLIVDDLDFVDLPLENGTLDDIIWGLSVGEHRIKLVYDNGVDYNGTDFYSNTFYVSVKEAPEPAKIKLTLKSTPVYKYAEKLVLQATLKQGSSPLKSKTVKFKFNGKTYSAQTNSKGIAKVAIKKSVLKKLKVGKKITYQASYGKTTAKKTVKVQSAETTLTLKKVTVKKSAKKAVLQATLKKGKSPLKSKTVKFKFNGKTYKAKTSSKGIAKVTIKKNVLKKLKAGKKITYQASYGKTTAKKTVTIKK